MQKLSILALKVVGGRSKLDAASLKIIRMVMEMVLVEVLLNKNAEYD